MYVAFYSLVIICFAVIANQIIEIPEGTEFNRYTDNYGNLGKSIYIVYVLSTYDAYPDNQLIGVR